MLDLPLQPLLRLGLRGIAALAAGDLIIQLGLALGAAAFASLMHEFGAGASLHRTSLETEARRLNLVAPQCSGGKKKWPEVRAGKLVVGRPRSEVGKAAYFAPPTSDFRPLTSARPPNSRFPAPAALVEKPADR